MSNVVPFTSGGIHGEFCLFSLAPAPQAAFHRHSFQQDQIRESTTGTDQHTLRRTRKASIQPVKDSSSSETRNDRFKVRATRQGHAEFNDTYIRSQCHRKCQHRSNNKHTLSRERDSPNRVAESKHTHISGRSKDSQKPPPSVKCDNGKRQGTCHYSVMNSRGMDTCS